MTPGDIAAVIRDAQSQPGRIGIDWTQFGALISALGALGIAAFGVTEALGKAFTLVYTRRRGNLGRWLKRHGLGLLAIRAYDNVTWSAAVLRLGLPYVGFQAVQRMARPFGKALACAYGDGYLEIVAQQYRADRGAGRAPDTIREGVKLGLSFMNQDDAARLIGEVWGLGREHSRALATALASTQPVSAEPPSTPEGAKEGVDRIEAAQLLAGRFATALDERVNAAFALAEQRYEAYAKMLSGAAAVILSLGFNLALPNRFSWWTAALLGLVAVPLAPVAKDLATSLQNALTAFKSIPTRRM